MATQPSRALADMSVEQRLASYRAAAQATKSGKPASPATVLVSEKVAHMSADFMNGFSIMKTAYKARRF